MTPEQNQVLMAVVKAVESVASVLSHNKHPLMDRARQALDDVFLLSQAAIVATQYTPATTQVPAEIAAKALVSESCATMDCAEVPASEPAVDTPQAA